MTECCVMKQLSNTRDLLRRQSRPNWKLMTGESTFVCIYQKSLVNHPEETCSSTNNRTLYHKNMLQSKSIGPHVVRQLGFLIIFLQC